jgi:hypothetical protein
MPEAKNYQPNDAYDLTATVAVSETESEVIDLRGTDLVGIFVPANFDGTDIKILAAPAPGGTFVEVQDGEGAALTIVTTVSKYAPIKNLALIAGLRYIKLKTTNTQTTTDTVFTLAVRPL